MKSLSRDWVFECDRNDRYSSILDADTREELSHYLGTNEQFEQDFKEKILRAVEKGLGELLHLNPPLFSQKISDSFGRKLKFKCERLPLGATAVHSPASETRSGMNEINLDLLGVWLASAGSSKHADLHKENVIEQMILHEFLHFLKIDNVSLRQHNYAKVTGDKGYSKSVDLVYSCTAQVYPTRSIIGVIHRQGRKGWGNTVKACQTCALGRMQDGQVVVSDDPNDRRLAKKKCQSLKEDLFAHRLKNPYRNPYIEDREFWLQDPFE